MLRLGRRASATGVRTVAFPASLTAELAVHLDLYAESSRHDLRHTGNTTTRELMQRMGHSSVGAALIYQHLVNGRDHTIAAHVDEQIKKVRPTESAAEGPEDASGTQVARRLAPARMAHERSRPRLPLRYR